MKWRSASTPPVPYWAMWVVTKQEPKDPSVGWWDGQFWWVFKDGRGMTCDLELVTHWHIMNSPPPPSD